MKEDIKNILIRLENSIKEPVLIGEDYYTGEGWQEPNFVTLDPTTNECKTLFNYITQLETNWNELKNYIDKTIIDSKAGSNQQYYYQQVYKFMQELEGNNE